MISDRTHRAVLARAVADGYSAERSQVRTWEQVPPGGAAQHQRRTVWEEHLVPNFLNLTRVTVSINNGYLNCINNRRMKPVCQDAKNPPGGAAVCGQPNNPLAS